MGKHCPLLSRKYPKKDSVMPIQNTEPITIQQLSLTTPFSREVIQEAYNVVGSLEIVHAAIKFAMCMGHRTVCILWASKMIQRQIYQWSL